MPLDFVPVVSQVKSFVQFACGDSAGAKQTQENFSKQCPIVAQARSGVEYIILKDRAAAKETNQVCIKTMKNVAHGAVDSIPIVGHCKGFVHLCTGDVNRAKNSVRAATRSTVAVGGAISGFLVAGPPGAVAGYVVGGLSVDAVSNSGHVKDVKDIISEVGNKKAGKIFDLCTCLVIEAFCVSGAVDMVSSICSSDGLTFSLCSSDSADSVDTGTMPTDNISFSTDSKSNIAADPVAGAYISLDQATHVNGNCCLIVDSSNSNMAHTGTEETFRFMEGRYINVDPKDVSGNIDQFSDNWEKFMDKAVVDDRFQETFTFDKIFGWFQKTETLQWSSSFVPGKGFAVETGTTL